MKQALLGIMGLNCCFKLLLSLCLLTTVQFGNTQPFADFLNEEDGQSGEVQNAGKIRMPAMAQKAGGSWKHESLKDNWKMFQPDENESNQYNTKHTVPGIEKAAMPAMAQKAGGRWNHEQLNENAVIFKPEVDDPKKEERKNQNDILYSDEDYDDSNCSRDMFYHIRGKQCVPLRCPGGNKMRNKATGECTMRSNPNTAEPFITYRHPKSWSPEKRRGTLYVPRIDNTYRRG